MKAKPIHFLNGKFVEDSDLVISVNDLGFTRGYAVFDFLVTYNGRPFMLDAHIDRLFNSAKLIGLDIPWSQNKVKEWTSETLKKNEGGGEKMIKIILSGGVSLGMEQEKEPTIVITCYDRAKVPDSRYKEGVALMSVLHKRYRPLSKTNNYIEAVMETKRAKKIGAYQPLYYDDSQIFEGSNTNIFTLINGELLTPKTNILLGITRGVLIDILNLNVSVLERDFSIKELLEAEEVFITGSNTEVIPVIRIDEKIIGEGKIGPVTKDVMKQFEDYTKSDKW